MFVVAAYEFCCCSCCCHDLQFLKLYGRSDLIAHEVTRQVLNHYRQALLLRMEKAGGGWKAE